MTAPRYRAAIIGTGRIASLLERDPLRPKPHTHAGWYAWCPRTELVAGCDLDATRLAEFGQQWGLPGSALFTDYREMLSRVRPDIVSVCAYAPDRRAMIEAALACGVRGLWIEKAIACSLDEAAAITHGIERHGAAAVVDQPRRGDAQYLGVRDVIASRRWGALQSVHCLMSGHLMHTGVHAWDVLQLWCGEWQWAAAWLEGSTDPQVGARARRGTLPPVGSPTGDEGARTLDPPKLDAMSRVSGGASELGGRSLPQPAATPVAEAGVSDAGGHAHIVFDGPHAFVSAGLKGYFVFQFDLVFEHGRIHLGNDVAEGWTPGPSPRYTGFVELVDRTACPQATPSPPMVVDLVEALDLGTEPRMSVRHAVEAFRLGVALFQSHAEGHRPVGRHEVRSDLYVASV